MSALVAGVVFSVLIGCGGTEGPAQATTDAPADGPPQLVEPPEGSEQYGTLDVQ